MFAQLTYIPSGPGTTFRQRTCTAGTGRCGCPGTGRGDAVTVRLGERELSGAALREAVGGFALDGITAAFFGPQGTEYELPFE